MTTSTPRSYSSHLRTKAAADTRQRILDAAVSLMGRKGVAKVKIADIAETAGVATSTVYAGFKSKEGLLRALMQEALFGGAFRSAQQLLDEAEGPVRLIALTSQVARAIYDSESRNLGLLRHASGFTPELRKIEQEFEQIRYDMQEKPLALLYEAGCARPGLPLAEARRILWMYTSRDVYRMLVSEGGWSGERYQDWLSETLLDALVDPSRRT